MSFPESLGGKLLYAVATAAALGGGTSLIDNTITNARQDEQIIQMLEMKHTLEKTAEDVSAIKLDVAVMKAIQTEKDRHREQEPRN